LLLSWGWGTKQHRGGPSTQGRKEVLGSLYSARLRLSSFLRREGLERFVGEAERKTETFVICLKGGLKEGMVTMPALLLGWAYPIDGGGVKRHSDHGAAGGKKKREHLLEMQGTWVK